jgi:hypothetical protein
MIEYFLYYIGGASVLIGAIAWLIKSLMSHFMSKDIELYKNQLKSSSELEIEKLKNELKIQEQKHDVMFSKLHSKRIEVIDELYKLVQDVIGLAAGFGGCFIFGASTQRKKSADNLFDACGNLASYYNAHRLYLSPDIVLHLDSLVKMIAGIVNEYAASSYMADSESEYVKRFQKEIWSHEKELMQISEEIESEFRALVGSDI